MGRMVIAILLVGCTPAYPSRDDCAVALAHQWMVEDLAALAGDPELVREVGKDFVKSRLRPAEAYQALRSSEMSGRAAGSAELALARCQKEMSHAHLACVERSASLEAIAKCPP